MVTPVFGTVGYGEALEQAQSVIEGGIPVFPQSALDNYDSVL